MCKCLHEEIAHYTLGRNCVVDGCSCKEYKAKGRPEFTGKKGKCNYGHAHNSGDEIKYCSQLHYQKLAGEIIDFDAEVNLPLYGPSGSVIASYKCDFVIKLPGSVTEFVEIKGNHLMNAGQWPLKWKLLMDMHKGDHRYLFRVVKT